MREINLREYERSPGVPLSARERDMLRGVLPSVAIEPAPGVEGTYHLTPGSVVGAFETSGLSVFIEPKIGIAQLLSLACYAIGRIRFRPEDFRFPKESALPDILALALSAQARRAFSGGLLHGYRTEEEALMTVRGRIRLEEQLRRRFDTLLPVELQYDEFTNDILPNRLVKAAAHRLGRIHLRSPEARQNLGRVAGILDGVSLVEFAPARVPAVAFDRLTEHYRDVIGLARLILGHGAFESGRGVVRASGFLMDMNVVFQEFLTQALRDVLGASPETLRSDRELQNVTLDHEGRVSLRPDLTWWDGPECLFVGDAKYKNVTGARVPNADLYQLLSYATALGLPGGLLVYAQGEAEPASYTVHRCGTRLEVAALDLTGALGEILEAVRYIAKKVVRLRDEAGGVGPGIVLNTLSARPRVASARTFGVSRQTIWHAQQPE